MQDINSFQITHMIYYGITVVNYFTQSKALRKFSDSLFATLVIPLGLLVFAMYWGFSYLGNDFVFPVPKGEKYRYPRWLNFVLHTNVAVSPFLDMLVTKHSYPNRWKSIIILLGVLVCYLSVILLVKYKTDKWIYGILGKCDHVQRTILIGFVGVVGVLFYLFGELCNYNLVVKRNPKCVKKSE